MEQLKKTKFRFQGYLLFYKYFLYFLHSNIFILLFIIIYYMHKLQNFLSK